MSIAPRSAGSIPAALTDCWLGSSFPNMTLDAPHRTGEIERKAPVVHLTCRGGLLSVYMAQVVRPMSLLNGRGHPVTLAVLTPVGELLRPRLRRKWRQQRRAIQNDFGLELRRLPSPPSRARNLWSDAAVLRAWLGTHYRGAAQVILHCRSTSAAKLALAVAEGDPRYFVVHDCRGVEGPEALYKRGYACPEQAPLSLRKSAEQLEILQRRVAERSHSVVCVSTAMKQYVQDGWGIDEAKIQVVPCCTDVDGAERASAIRAETRERLNLQDRYVVAYCGSMAPWQMVEETLATFQAISTLRSDAHFLGITTSPDALRRAVRVAGLDPARYTILSVQHSEVAVNLAAADLGLLLRQRSPVNEVAAPVKFAEYLACGVPVLLSAGIGDYSEETNTHGLGVVVSAVARGEEYRTALRSQLLALWHDPDRARTRSMLYARERLGWDAAVDRLSTLYNELCADSV